MTSPNPVPFEKTEDLWRKLSEHFRLVHIGETFPATRVSDPNGDLAETEIHVQNICVHGDNLVIQLTAGTVRRRVRSNVHVPLGKIDFARAIAGARKDKSLKENKK